MKIRLYLASIMMLVFFSCQKTEINHPEDAAVSSVFYGEIESQLETKTTLDKNNNVRWSEGDQVIIFNGSTLGCKYQVTDDSIGETSAGFELIEETTGEFVSGSDIDHNIAFYPFSSKMKCAKGDDKEPTESYELTKITLPAVQEYFADSFGQETFPMVAVTSSVSDHRLTFKNVLGGMKLQLKGVCTVSSITVNGHAEEPLAGTADVIAYVDGSAPELFLNDDAVTSVSLDCGNEGVELNPEIPTDFIIALPPTVFKSGFSVVITDVKGEEMTVKTSKENVVYRSSLLRMPVIDVTLSAYEKPRLGLIENEAILSSESGKFAVSVDANVEYEVVMPEAEWIRHGESKDYIESFVVDANEGYEDRSVDIIFRNVEHDLQAVFNVRQMQKDAIIVAKPEYEIDVAGGSISLEIQTNVDFDISIAEDAQEWISLVGTRVLESKSLTFLIAPCASDIERTGLITFAKDTLEQIVKITQYDLRAGESIVFADDQVKAACVAKFDANSDGELSYREAAAVESISGVNFPKTITSFDEFQYFTGVTSVPASCFANFGELTSVILPESVTRIESRAFTHCEKLCKSPLTTNVVYIGVSAFEKCSAMAGPGIFNPLVEIRNSAFEDCSTLSDNIVIPGTATIEHQIFAGCISLESVVVEIGQTKIPSNMFWKCTNLKELMIPDSVTEIGYNAFSDCASLVKLELPSCLTILGNGVFSSCSSLEEIVIPDNITVLPRNTFDNCTSLKSVNLPDNMTIIGDYAFSDCTSLAEIALPRLLVSINQGAFERTAITSLECPDKLESIEGGAFSLCKLKSIDWSESLLTIGDGAFRDCDGLIGELDLPESLTYLGFGAFAMCDGFSSLIIGGSDLGFNNGVFSNCSGLESITFRDGGTYDFFVNTFSSCTNLKSVVLPEGITEVPGSMFLRCVNLKSVTIPASVTSIGNSAFYECDLNEMIVSALIPPALGTDGLGTGFHGLIYVPGESLDAYKEDWSQYADQIVAI